MPSTGVSPGWTGPRETGKTGRMGPTFTSTPIMEGEGSGGRDQGVTEWSSEWSSGGASTGVKFSPSGPVSGDSIWRADPTETSSGRGRKERKPQFYDGRGSWSDYLFGFEAVAEWNGCQEDEKAAQLIMSLSGRAQQIANSKSEATKRNYSSLVGVLQQAFDPPEREIAHRLTFEQRVRKPSESVMDFGHELTRLALKAYPNMDEGERERQLVFRFVNGLGKKEIKEHVFFRLSAGQKSMRPSWEG